MQPIQAIVSRQVSIPVVHIHVAGDAIHRAFAGILPHFIPAVIAAGGMPFRHPAVPVFKHRIGQVVFPPVQAGVNAYLISLGTHDIAEDPCDLCQAAVSNHQLTVLFHVIEDRQIRIITLQKAYRMGTLFHSHFSGYRIGIKVYTVGNPQALTLGGISGPLLVILLRQVHTKAATNDRKIHTGSLDRFPVDHSLVMTYVNAPVSLHRKSTHSVRKIHESFRHVALEPLTILITPAVFLAGLRQLIQPAFPLRLPGSAHVFHCHAGVFQLIQQIQQFIILLSRCHCHGSRCNGVDLLQSLFQLFLAHHRHRSAFFQQLPDLILLLFQRQLRDCGGFRALRRLRAHGRHRRCGRCRTRSGRRSCGHLRGCGGYRCARGLRRFRRRLACFRRGCLRGFRSCHCFRKLCRLRGSRWSLAHLRLFLLRLFLLKFCNDLFGQSVPVILCKYADSKGIHQHRCHQYRA